MTLFSPLNFCYWVKITDLAGMFKPIAKVDVAKTTLRRLSVNKISTISLSNGIIPAWWNPIPRSSRLHRFTTWGSCRSSSSSLSNAFFLKSFIRFLSKSPMKVSLSSTSFARSSTCFLLKKKTTQGSKPSFLMCLKFLKNASNFFWPDFWLFGPWPSLNALLMALPVAFCFAAIPFAL